MQKTAMTAQDWIYVLSQIALRVEGEMDRLNELDGAIGDGDHGISMAIGFRALRRSVENLDGTVTIDRVFQTAGRAFLSSAGGAAGPLVGSMLNDTGKVFTGRVTFGAEEIVWMLETMEQALVSRGKAELGNKTMLEALHPAVLAAQSAAGEDMVEMLRMAANAAEAGARDQRNGLPPGPVQSARRARART